MAHIKISRIIVLVLILGLGLSTASYGSAQIWQRLHQGSKGRTPEIKQFDWVWVNSLLTSDKAFAYTRDDSSAFEYIGMPVGGICAGQLYLGGDGKLWFWDIFNSNDRHGTVKGEEAYEFPYQRSVPEKGMTQIEQGFAIRIKHRGQVVSKILDRDGFVDIAFVGQYPIGSVHYVGGDTPVDVQLDAFSPFVPLNLDDSMYPATILQFTLENTSSDTVEVDLAGWLENAVCVKTRGEGVSGELVNVIQRQAGLNRLECSVQPSSMPRPSRPDRLIEDFEGGYENWKIVGEAFGSNGVPNYHQQPLRNYQGKKLADSFHNRGVSGSDADGSDRLTGKLISQPFTITHRRIKCLVGGGRHKGKTCIDVVVGGKVVASTTGDNSETLRWKTLDVGAHEGESAHIEIVDSHQGGWGHVLVDQIMLTDNSTPLDQLYDYGSMSLSLLQPGSDSKAVAAIRPDEIPNGIFSSEETNEARAPLNAGPLVGALAKSVTLKPEEQTKIEFILTWYFPNTRVQSGEVKKYYGKRFGSAVDVADEIVARYADLVGDTYLWRRTWYDSTLPSWFLDRSFLNTSILASSTCHMFEDGRFYGFEGGYQGQGTCTHVWGYVHAPGRLFPQLEYSLRKHTDFSPMPDGGFDPETGLVKFRGRARHGLAVDGQSGIILRSYLTHQMMPDKRFLEEFYSRIKLAMNHLTNAKDANHDGILEGSQHNTLDGDWWGKVTWLSLHYQAALRAMAKMAEEMKDTTYARQCVAIADRGKAIIETELFNGEYFFHIPDPNNPKKPGMRNGCEYSQLLGQSWAYQVGLGQILDPVKVSTALDSLWRFNFSTDVGPYREVFKGGRWYAMPGEGGLIACTWPNGGLAAQKEAFKYDVPRHAAYNNECQNGYEYACMSLMMWHGFPYRSLAFTRTMHEDRYHGAKRNPWCEVEWGIHYSRSMASYGLFTATCGFEYHGPKGYMAFSPRITPEDFRAAFTSAQGWGTLEQKRSESEQTERLSLRWGKLTLKQMAFDIPKGRRARAVRVKANGVTIANSHRTAENRVIITLANSTSIEADQDVNIEIQW